MALPATNDLARKETVVGKVSAAVAENDEVNTIVSAVNDAAAVLLKKDLDFNNWCLSQVQTAYEGE
jgi:hypothetical protein